MRKSAWRSSFSKIATFRVNFSIKQKKIVFRNCLGECEYRISCPYRFSFCQGVRQNTQIYKMTYIQANIGIFQNRLRASREFHMLMASVCSKFHVSIDHRFIGRWGNILLQLGNGLRTFFSTPRFDSIVFYKIKTACRLKICWKLAKGKGFFENSLPLKFYFLKIFKIVLESA